MNKLRIYDVDGTLTHPGNDLWYLSTKNLCLDVVSFDLSVESWKKDIELGKFPYQASYQMMLKGLNLMPDNGNLDVKIRNISKDLSLKLIIKNKYYPKAIEHINNSLDQGYQIVFSTTNYHNSLEGFLDALIEANLVSLPKSQNIYLSGSKIDWVNKKILHFNMAQDKIKGICDLFSLKKESLAGQIDSCYGDDPLGNDQGILELTKKAFVIKNKKNGSLILPKNMRLVTWDEII